jgi:hypothetical protein
VRAFSRVGVYTDDVGFEADIARRAMIFETSFPALEVPGAFHIIDDFLKFLAVPLLHIENIALIKVPGQCHLITEKTRSTNQYSGFDATGKGRSLPHAGKGRFDPATCSGQAGSPLARGEGQKAGTVRRAQSPVIRAFLRASIKASLVSGFIK